MRTVYLSPTSMWNHALSNHNCSKHLLLVSHLRGFLIGWCRAFPTIVSNEVELGMGLLPHCRNQGLGTYLVKRTISWSKEREINRIVLTTHIDNHRAIHVFNKCGFTKVENCDNMWMKMVNVF